ncbi:AAA family ATPase [Streptacidiphilus fuscans]|uniref:MoxR family ATPase n=1 Tax=Streptacidiphilus fuscans TaxID=2789292 RepID=A0A931B551_9ACTN|nr:MoxR family ATPase [Streptacidiphilus fuscans]
MSGPETDQLTPRLTPREAGVRAHAVLDEIERAVVGKRAALELVMLGVLAGGHVLIEDLPGLGKTLLARSFATVLGLDFRRIQFTPDLLPSDVTGAPFYDQRTGEMVFRPGPVFTHLLLADEINRTPPKTQAALLEAMAEGQVSVDGTTRRLPEPFVVIATDNPIEYEGTYTLPEAQLDRFLLRVRMGYLPVADEAAMLRRRLDRTTPEAVLTPLGTPAELVAMRDALERVEVDSDLVDYVVALIDGTRGNPQIQVGASPRGGLALVQLARARAVMAGRDYVVPEDVKAVAIPGLAHRVTLKPELWVRRITADDVVAGVVQRVPTPRTTPRTATQTPAQPSSGASGVPAAGKPADAPVGA